MTGKLGLTRWAVLAAAVMALASCGKQEAARIEQAADKAAAEVKAKAEADVKAAEAAAKELEAREIAMEAYVYAYPLVTMEITRRVMTNVEKPEGSKAPVVRPASRSSGSGSTPRSRSTGSSAAAPPTRMT